MITLIKPSSIIISISNNPLELIENAGRTCYKSEDKITNDSASKFVRMVVKRGHESVIEHASATVRIICDRGVSHELVRHRVASFSQESTRYVNYKDRGMEFVIPPWVDLKPGKYTDLSIHEIENMADKIWVLNCLRSFFSYEELLRIYNWRPEQARCILNNSLKTEVVMTANVREWRHVFKLRCSSASHPQMREVMIPLLHDMAQKIPVIFDDILDKYQR
jgi:thymidylate synthase (FAD)